MRAGGKRGSLGESKNVRNRAGIGRGQEALEEARRLSEGWKET